MQIVQQNSRAGVQRNPAGQQMDGAIKTPAGTARLAKQLEPHPAVTSWYYVLTAMHRETIQNTGVCTALGMARHFPTCCVAVHLQAEPLRCFCCDVPCCFCQV